MKLIHKSDTASASPYHKSCALSEVHEYTDAGIDLFRQYHINCRRCSGLCCVALYCTKTDGFPENKDAGIPCKHLQGDYMCEIHGSLSSRKLKGCTAYDCFGAGQHITQLMSEKPDWNSISRKEGEMIVQSYLTVMQLHQILWYLTEASIISLINTEKNLLNTLIAEGKKLAEQPLNVLQSLNIESYRERSNKQLKHISKSITATLSGHSVKETGKNYMGKNMQKKNLIGKDFTVSCLIAAGLEQANLYGANFLGADMRDTNIRNTDLSQSLFLTQIQINSAIGSRNTVLPPYLYKPMSWED